MTLDEAIKHCKEKAKELREQPFKEKMDIEDIADCEECAEEHEQLAEWLEDYKRLLEEKVINVYPNGDVIVQDIRPQGKWIPVSERLPEYTGLYLISVDDVVTVANFTGTYFMHRGGGRVAVYAWQPLPDPYMKGGAE